MVYLCQSNIFPVKPVLKFSAMLMIFASLACFVFSPGNAQVANPNVTLTPDNSASNPVITGLVTDACSGAVVAGAKVTIGSGAGAVVTYSGSTGTYLVSSPIVGYQPIAFFKTGYDDFTGTVLLAFNATTIQNAALLCTPVPPENVTAVIDNPTSPTFVNLAWSPPQGNYQLIYDDGFQEVFSIWATSGNLHALRFSPLAWPAKVTGGSVNIGVSSKRHFYFQPMGRDRWKLADIQYLRPSCTLRRVQRVAAMHQLHPISHKQNIAGPCCPCDTVEIITVRTN